MNDGSSVDAWYESGWVYIISQNHPHLGLKLYDIGYSVVRVSRVQYNPNPNYWLFILIQKNEWFYRQNSK